MVIYRTSLNIIFPERIEKDTEPTNRIRKGNDYVTSERLNLTLKAVLITRGFIKVWYRRAFRFGTWAKFINAMP